MKAKAKRQVYDYRGRPVALGIELARGGEGVIFEVADESDLVAKLYHQAIDQEKTAKIATMVTLRTERLMKLAAWPVETLLDRPGGLVTGFLMPRVTAHKEIHLLYGVKSRLVEYPEACWPFLIQAAANVARAFHVVHEHGHVIGDVNHGGIVVSKTATVKLVDCDSFQISAQGHQYLCEVGIDTHTPPDLQGQPLRGIIRTPNHDAFGLAVIVFQLLFMGRHPFSGAFLGAGEMPIEKAIREYRFAYGAGAASRQMRQPPATLPLEAVSPPVAQLFERAFARGSLRPRAEEWISALTALSVNLKQCGQNNGHYFLNTLSSCPWCEIETRSGVMVFNPVVIVGTWTSQGGFNITSIWAQVTAVEPPGPLPELPVKSSLSVTPSPKAVRMRRGRFFRSLLASGLLVVLATAMIALPIGGAAAVWLIIIAGVAAISITHGGGGDVRRELEKAKRETERRWHEVEQRWRTQADEGRFHAKLRELEAKKAEHQNLPNIRLQKLRQLEIDLRERQRHKFLDRYRIDSAQIKGIGHARKITLRSYGIETADDLTERAILAVPGFGPTYTAKLLAWRRSIEQQFVFDPTQGVDPADRAAVEREVAATRLKLEEELRTGPQQLLQISRQIRGEREVTRSTVDATLKTLAQTEADLGQGSQAALASLPIALAFLASVISIAAFKLESFSSVKNYNAPSPATQMNVNAAGSKLVQPQNTHAKTSQDLSYEAFQRATQPQNTNANTQVASPEQQAKALYDQGVSFTKAGKYEDAAKAYEQAVALKPDLAEAQHELGYAYFKLGKFEESVAASKQAITLKPKNAETYRNLGLAYKALGRWDDAVGAFKKAIEFTPEHAATYYNLGLIFKEMKDNGAAIKAYQEAARLNPNNAQAHYELGLSYLAAGDLASATGEYTTLTSLNHKLADRLHEMINNYSRNQ